MKCLVLAPEYPPTKGGIANAAATFTKQMAQRGWTMKVCTQAWPDLPDEKVEEEGRVHRLRIKGDASLWNRPAGDIESLQRITESFRPDIAVIHGWQEWCVMMLPFLREIGVPVILQGHSFTFHRMVWKLRPPFGLRRWLGYQPFIWKMPNLLRELHALVVLGKNPDYHLCFDHWIGSRFAANHLRTIPNGAPRISASCDAFWDLCPEACGKRIILTVANYSETKNQLLILAVAQRLEHTGAFFVLIGSEENDYSAKLRSEIKRRNLSSRIVMCTGLQRSITESAIHSCDVALLTSRTEMQPLFLLEAMSIGKPWVCPNVGSVSELEGGFVVPMNAAVIATKIRELLENPGLYAASSAAAQAQWRAEFDPDKVYSKWDALMHEAVAVDHESWDEESISH